MPRITKTDAAYRQLSEAIKLFFEHRDAVSIHALVAASHELLCDLARHREKDDGFKYAMLTDPIRREKGVSEEEWFKALYKPRNFFKHANNDPDGVLEFDARENVLWLVGACVLYRQLCVDAFSPDIPAIDTFLSWYQLTLPEERRVIELPLLKICTLAGIPTDDYDFFRDHCDDSAAKR